MLKIKLNILFAFIHSNTLFRGNLCFEDKYQLFNFILKILRLSDCFVSSETNFHIFGPRMDNDSVP